MATPGDEGAAAAASYFISLYGYANVTGDLAEWSAMSSPECTFCSNVRAEVERVAAAGGRTEGGEVTILSATGAEVTEGQWYSAKLEVRIAPSQELAEDGAVVTEDDGGDYVVDLALSWNGAWLIDAVGITPAGAGT